MAVGAFYFRDITLINTGALPMTLTKADLIDRIHESDPKLTKTQARETVETILSTMKSCLENGDDVLLSNFGKFSLKDKATRKGRNPQTGEEMILDARKVVTFKPSGKLRKLVNEK